MITQVLKGSNYVHCEDKQENMSPRYTDSPLCPLKVNDTGSVHPQLCQKLFFLGYSPTHTH